MLNLMRRIWFTLLLALTVAYSATASAWAMQACPYKATPAAHACCPDQPAAPEKSDPAKKMDCKLGQACRTTHAVAAVTPVVSTGEASAFEQPLLRDQAGAPSTILTGLWRPPRAI